MKHVVFLFVMIAVFCVNAQPVDSVLVADSMPMQSAPTHEGENTVSSPTRIGQTSLFFGVWQRVGGHYKATISITADTLYYYEKFFSQSDSKMEDYWRRFMLSNDSLVLWEFGKLDTQHVFWVQRLTLDSLVLQDAETFEIEAFTRKSIEAPVITRPTNELKLMQGVLECDVDLSNATAGAMPCLHIGDLNLETRFAVFEERYGKPIRSIQSTKDSAVSKYLFHLPVFEGTQPELIVTYDKSKDEVREIQLRGYGVNEDLRFSSIKLGDYISYVEQKFGKPTDKTYDAETLITKWSYAPYPLMFEFKNKYVYGVKIFRKSQD